MHISINVPERFLITEEASALGSRVVLYAALLMFRSGELSAGAAAEFAGVDRFTFAAECKRHDIPLINYDPDDLQSELDTLRRVS